MSKHIKLEDAIKRIERIKAELSDSKPQPMPITICNWFLADIQDLPTIDIVHCKDCTFFRRNNT